MSESKKRVLHVDDEADVREVVETILEKEGLEVTGAESGAQALMYLEKDSFDIILLDIMMPDISGWELFTHITEMKKVYNVIFLSVLEISEERLAKLKEQGVKDYITKPFDQDDFVSRVKKVLP